MKLLVTGVHGWIASAFACHCRALGFEIRGTSRSRGQGINVIPAIDGATDWNAALVGCDTVVHLAARAHLMAEQAANSLSAFREVNTDGTLNLAHQAAAYGVRRFVFVSSVKVNGEGTPAGRAFREDDPPAPLDPYAISKLEAEDGLLALAMASGMEVVIIRPPLVYGPGVKGNFASMVKWLTRGIPLPLGAVHNARSLVALENLVDFITLCADRERSPSAANQTFLISDYEDVSTTELLKRVAHAFGLVPRLFPISVEVLRMAASLAGCPAVAERLLDSLLVDSAKARDLLGWRPVTTMDAQLLKMARNAANF